MNLVELERRKSELLAELATETACNYIARIASENQKHEQTCKACMRKREIGREYEKIQKQIKRLQGRANAPARECKVQISDHIRQLAKLHGISRHALYRRIKKGMEPRVAATKPMQEQKRRR